MANIARSGRRLCAELLEDRRQLAAVTVTTHLDVVNAGDGLTSLREAIQTTNAAAGADEIYFDAALSGQTIVLQTGQLKITDHLTINGLGADELAISGNGVSRIFSLGEYNPGLPSVPKEITISGLTLKDGNGGGAGGAIFSLENLTLVDSVVTNNKTSWTGLTEYLPEDIGGGAGIYVAEYSLHHTTKIIRSEITGNTVTNPPPSSWFLGGRDGYNGGGIVAGGTLIVSDSVIANNQAGPGVGKYWTDGNRELRGGNGGGIHATGTVTIERSVFTDNRAGVGAEGDRGRQGIGFPAGPGGSGGGLSVSGNVTIVDSKFEGNAAGAGGTAAYNRQGDGGDGGGIYYAGTATTQLTITNSEIVENTTPSGKHGGAYTVEQGSHGGRGAGIAATGRVLVQATTIAGNVTGDGGVGIVVPFISVSKAAGHGGNGGGVWFGGVGAKTIDNSTISGNAAGNGGNDVVGGISGNGGSGGGIWFEGTGSLTVVRSTVANNSVGEGGAQSVGGLGGGVQGQGGGIFNSVAATAVTLNHSIVALNVAVAAHSDLAGPGQFAVDYTLLGTDVGALIVNGTGNQIGSIGTEIDPLLGPLADNGGPTQTRALLVGSPALDAGDATLTAGTGGTPEFDQRRTGYARIVGAKIDLGSFEAGEAAPPTSADFDDNGSVDGFDFLLWQRGEGDADDDEDSDGADLQIWSETFGQATSPPPAAVAVEAFTAPLLADEEATPKAEELTPTGWFASLSGWSIAGGELAVKPTAALLALKKEAHCLAFEQFRTLRTEPLTTSARLADAFENLASADEELPAEEAFELVLEGLFLQA